MNNQEMSAYVKLLLNAIRDQNLDLIKQILNTRNLIKINEIEAITLSAFDHLAKNGNLEIALILINYGFNLKYEEAQESHRIKTPLHTACEHGHVNIVQILVNSFNMRLDCRDDREMTPLHWAVECQNYDTIAYILINHLNQIDFNAVDRLNRTVHEIALITRNTRIISLIEEKIKYKTKLDQQQTMTASSSNLFNKTQFNIKSFAKPIKIPPSTRQQPPLEENDDLFELSVESRRLRSPSLSPQSRQMKDTLNWLESQLVNTTDNATAEAPFPSENFDLLNQVQNGCELVLTDAGKQLLEFTDERESTSNLLKKLAKGFENRYQEQGGEEEEEDNDEEESNPNMVKRCRFSSSPKPQHHQNQFDIEIESFINNFLNSR